MEILVKNIPVGMSAFNGRRVSNVSQYVANLNAIPSAHDAALQQQEGFSLEDDLAMFTNTEFFDFDLGDTAVAAPVAPSHDEAKGLDFLNGRSQRGSYISVFLTRALLR